MKLEFEVVVEGWGVRSFGSERMRARTLKLTFRTRIHVPTLVSPTCNFRTLSLQYMLQPFIPGDVCRVGRLHDG